MNYAQICIGHSWNERGSRPINRGVSRWFTRNRISRKNVLAIFEQRHTDVCGDIGSSLMSSSFTRFIILSHMECTSTAHHVLNLSSLWLRHFITRIPWSVRFVMRAVQKFLGSRTPTVTGIRVHIRNASSVLTQTYYKSGPKYLMILELCRCMPEWCTQSIMEA